MSLVKDTAVRGGPVRILTFTTLYPSEARPIHGIFVENRLRHLVATGRVTSRVMAPVPWFPSRLSLFGGYSVLARTPLRENRHGIAIEHPRYPILPSVGMTTAPALLFAATYRRMRKSGLDDDFDLIDAHYFYPDGVAAALLGRALGKPVVITARGSDINQIAEYSVPRKMICYAAKNVAGLIAVSQALKDALVRLGVNPQRITVLRNGVDLNLFTPGDRDRIRADLKLTGRVLLSVGHLIERKGHDLAIKSLARLKDSTLLIVGDGPERSRLSAMASALNVSARVRFLGAIPHEHLRDLYVAADAVVLASSREGWPNVLLEAMACGTPVVASPIWGNPEIVCAPQAGVLMRERTSDDLVDAVERLFKNLPRREATRAFAERFSWDETSNGLIRLFKQILSVHSATGRA